MSSRQDMIYTDDTDTRWIVRNLDTTLAVDSELMGFVPFDAASHSELDELPRGFRMRRINLVHRDKNSGRVRRRSYPCGKLDAQLYLGTAGLTITSSGIAAGGGFSDSIPMLFLPSSTTGELRPFVVVADPGYVDLVHDVQITVEPSTTTP